MHYKYFHVAELLGGFNLTDADKTEVASHGSMRAYLSKNVDTQLADLDRANAIGTMMLKGMFGQLASSDYDTNLAAEIAAIRSARTKQAGNSNLLSFEFTEPIDVSIGGNMRERDDYIVCFDAVDKNAVKKRHQQDLDAIKFAIAVASNTLCKYRTVADGLYLLTDDRKKVYSYSFSGGTANAFISRAFTNDARDRVVPTFESIANRQEISRTVHLFSLMADDKADKLRTFLFGWTALEIFVNKMFQFYHEQFIRQVSSGALTALSARYFDRIQDVMRDKFTLADKFLVISLVLVRDGSGEADLNQFTQLKKLRDNLFHGESIDEQTLPVHILDTLLRKYVAAHASETHNVGANGS